MANLISLTAYPGYNGVPAAGTIGVGVSRIKRVYPFTPSGTLNAAIVIAIDLTADGLNQKGGTVYTNMSVANVITAANA